MYTKCQDMFLKTRLKIVSDKISTYIDNGVSIQKPHYSWFGISSNATTEPWAISFANFLRLRFGNETRLKFLSFLFDHIWSSLPSRLHFTDLVNASHALGQLRLIDNAWLARSSNNSSGFINSKGILGPADIFSWVFWIHPPKVHGYVTKVIDWSEPIFWKRKNI